jgi:hypothetical protein
MKKTWNAQIDKSWSANLISDEAKLMSILGISEMTYFLCIVQRLQAAEDNAFLKDLLHRWLVSPFVSLFFFFFGC